MKPFLKMFIGSQLKLTILISSLLIINIAVISSLIYFYNEKIYQKNSIIYNKILTNSFEIEKNRVQKDIQLIKNIHLKFVRKINNANLDNIDNLLKKFKTEVENKFNNTASIAIMNSNLIIAHTTLPSEQGLDLKQFEDAVFTTNKLLDKKDISFVYIDFPVYTPATKTFKLYSTSYLPNKKIYLQIGLDLNFLKNFYKIKADFKESFTNINIFVGGIGKGIEIFNIIDGQKYNLSSDINNFILSKYNIYTKDTFLNKNYYLKIAIFPYYNLDTKTFLILRVSFSKKPVYFMIFITILIESIIFIFLYFMFKNQMKYYKTDIIRPFKQILFKIKNGKPVEKLDEFGIRELYLLSIYYNKLINELNIKQEKLENAIEEIRILTKLIPICSSCKKIRNDDGSWDRLEQYLQNHFNFDFTHGICPDCVKKLYPDYADEILKNKK